MGLPRFIHQVLLKKINNYQHVCWKRKTRFAGTDITLAVFLPEGLSLDPEQFGNTLARPLAVA